MIVEFMLLNVQQLARSPPTLDQETYTGYDINFITTLYHNIPEYIPDSNQ